MRKLREVYKELNKIEWFEPVFVIGMSLLITLCIILGVRSIFNQENISIINNEAEEYFYEGKYDEAIDEYRKLNKKEKWPIYKVKMAEVYSIKGDIDKSNSLLKEAVILRNRLIESNKDKYLTEDKELINEVVFNFFMNKEYEQAVSLGEDYLLSGNMNKPLVRTMFAVYTAIGQADNAKYLVEQYEVDENSSYDLSLFATMQLMSGDVKDGIETLKKAYKLDKNDIKVFDVIEDFEDYNKEDLLESLTELSDLYSDEEAYKLFLAKMYSKDMLNYREAENILNSLEESLKENINYKLIKAEILIDNEREDEAKELIETIVNSEERTYAVDYITAVDYYNKGQYDKALEFCKKSIIDNSNYPNNYMVLMPKIFKDSKDINCTESYFRTALLKEPFNFNMIVKIGDYYASELSQYDNASEYYELALIINPKDPELYYDLGMMEICKEEHKKAIEYIEQAIEIDDENGKYYRTLGVELFKVGENEKSIEATRNAYSLDEHDVLALSNAGVYYISVEENIWRGFSNIEAAYEEMPNWIDEESKKQIMENYTYAKKVFNNFINDENKKIAMSEFKLFY